MWYCGDDLRAVCQASSAQRDEKISLELRCFHSDLQDLRPECVRRHALPHAHDLLPEHIVELLDILRVPRQ